MQLKYKKEIKLSSEKLSSLRKVGVIITREYTEILLLLEEGIILLERTMNEISIDEEIIQYYKVIHTTGEEYKKEEYKEGGVLIISDTDSGIWYKDKNSESQQMLKLTSTSKGIVYPPIEQLEQWSMDVPEEMASSRTMFMNTFYGTINIHDRTYIVSHVCRTLHRRFSNGLFFILNFSFLQEDEQLITFRLIENKRGYILGETSLYFFLMPLKAISSQAAPFEYPGENIINLTHKIEDHYDIPSPGLRRFFEKTDFEIKRKST